MNLSGAALRYLFFDATGTLIRVKGSIGAIYARVAREFNLELDPKTINQKFPHALQQAPLLCFPQLTGEELIRAQKDWWQERVREVLEPAITGDRDLFKRFFQQLYRVFSRAESWEVFPDVLPFLNEMKHQAIPCAVISNFDSRLHGLLRELGLAPFFEQIICSGEVGFAKPQREIFELALPAGIPVSQVGLIGDNWERDIEPAMALGMKTFFLQRDQGDTLSGGTGSQVDTFQRKVST